MPAHSDPKPLYRIDECPDLMADGCVGDEQGNLVFLSIWARDTAIQEFLARLTLGRDEQGLDQFHVITEQGGSIPVFVGNVENLEKRSTRVFRRTLFGSMVNLWLFDRRCVKPTRPTPARWPCCPGFIASQPIGCGRCAGHLPTAVARSLATAVLVMLQAARCEPPAIRHRRVGRSSLAIDVPALTTALGDLIRNGTLGASRYELASGAPLRRVA